MKENQGGYLELTTELSYKSQAFALEYQFCDLLPKMLKNKLIPIKASKEPKSKVSQGLPKDSSQILFQNFIRRDHYSFFGAIQMNLLNYIKHLQKSELLLNPKFQKCHEFKFEGIKAPRKLVSLKEHLMGTYLVDDDLPKQ